MTKIQINKEDSIKEKKCKQVFNNNYFGQFRNNYDKFRQYSMLVGSFDNMKYASFIYNYYFMKINYPEFLIIVK